MLCKNYIDFNLPYLGLICLSNYPETYGDTLAKKNYEPDELDDIMESDLIYFLKNDTPKKFLYYTIKAIQSDYCIGPNILRMLFEMIMSLQSTYDDPHGVEEIVFKVISTLDYYFIKFSSCDIMCREDYIDCFSIRGCKIVNGLPLKCSVSQNFLELIFMLINDTLQLDGSLEDSADSEDFDFTEDIKYERESDNNYNDDKEYKNGDEEYGNAEQQECDEEYVGAVEYYKVDYQTQNIYDYAGYEEEKGECARLGVQQFFSGVVYDSTRDRF